MGDKSTTISVDFDRAAFLLSEDTQLSGIVRRNKKTLFNFPNDPIVAEELEQFKSNIHLQNYVNGIAKLRKLLHEHKQNHKNNLAKAEG